MSDIVTVSIACADAAEAGTLARHLVEARLAACVQSYPIQSTYIWDGQTETASEVMLTAKTVMAKLPDIEVMVKAHHSYQVPEILAQPVVWASADYERWLRDVLT